MQFDTEGNPIAKNITMTGALSTPTISVPSRMYSADLWTTCPWIEIERGAVDGIIYNDDFSRSMVQAANVAASATTLPDPWAAFTDATAASTISSVAEPTDALGAMALNITTAQEGIHMALMSQKNTGTIIDPGGLTSSNKVWLEARLKVSTVGANEIGMFFGLMEKSRVVTLGTIATLGGAVAAVDHLGFLKKSTGTTAIGTSTGNGTSTDVNAAAGVLAADTYIKLGLSWNGTTLKYWLNGTADGTTLTSSSTQFPATEGLTPMIGAISGTTAGDDIVTFDWVRFAYQRS